MVHSLKDLLGDAVGRAKITHQVTTARLIETANTAIRACLPKGRESDAWAATYHEGILTVHCAQAAAAEYLRAHIPDIASAIKQALPTAHLVRITMRLVHGKPDDLVLP